MPLIKHWKFTVHLLVSFIINDFCGSGLPVTVVGTIGLCFTAVILDSYCLRNVKVGMAVSTLPATHSIVREC